MKAEQRVAREHRRDASLPFHRFIYHVSKARDRIRDSIDTNPPDINTKTYEAVKAIWTNRGSWNTKWGVLPGMSWNHEQPRDDFFREGMAAGALEDIAK